MTLTAAHGEQTCYPVESLQAALGRSFGEGVAFSGTATGGVGLTLFMSNSGSWSLVAVNADGQACFVATGTQGRIPRGPVFIPLIPEDPA